MLLKKKGGGTRVFKKSKKLPGLQQTCPALGQPQQSLSVTTNQGEFSTFHPTQRPVSANQHVIASGALKASRFTCGEACDRLSLPRWGEKQGSIFLQNEAEARTGVHADVCRNAEQEDGKSNCSQR